MSDPMILYRYHKELKVKIGTKAVIHLSLTHVPDTVGCPAEQTRP